MQQPGQPMSFSNQTPEKPPRVDINWHPMTNSGNEVQLSDGTYLVGLPDTVMGEPDPGARVVLALLGEVLGLRARLEQLEARPQQPAPPPPGQMGQPVRELQANAAQFRESVMASGQHVPASVEAGTTNGSQPPAGSASGENGPQVD